MLKIPENYKVVVLLALSYPRQKIDLVGKVPHLTRRKKKLEEIVSFEEFGNKLART